MLDAIFDVSHHQGDVDFAAAQAAGMEAVIIKCSQGLTNVDPRWMANSADAGLSGLLVGAYHFGTGEDGAAQADHFLAQKPTGLLVLDFEANVGSEMTPMEAQAFIRRIVAETGIWPVLYADRSHAELMGMDAQIVTSCPLWLAQYRAISMAPTPPTGWREIALWQYSEKGTVAGVSGACDRSAFLLDEPLEDWWIAHSH